MKLLSIVQFSYQNTFVVVWVFGKEIVLGLLVSGVYFP